MANYPYYYPQNYQQNYPQNYQPQNNGINWVSGEAGAKSFLVGAGQSVLLMDAESNVFFIKSTDNSGMPMPLRIFDYTERTTEKTQSTAASIDPKDYVTREEFLKWAERLKDSLVKKGAKDESAV